MLIKSAADIQKITEGGKIIGEILEKLAGMCRPGISTWEIDQTAEKMIKEAGGRPAFKGFQSYAGHPPFPCTICASINHELVHGIARKDVILKDGDVFSIDIGMEWPVKSSQSTVHSSKKKGLFTDTAITVVIGEVEEKVKELSRVTKQSLEEGIKAVKPGNSIADIGFAIEKYVKSQGKYGIIRDLIGHGVGHEVHEEPRIPNYHDRSLESFKIKPGMVLAIEPMISLGSHKIKTASDGWTIEMADCSLCAHFEHTVVVTADGNVVATRRPRENF